MKKNGSTYQNSAIFTWHVAHKWVTRPSSLEFTKDLSSTHTITLELKKTWN